MLSFRISQNVMLCSSLRHHLMQFPDSGPNLLKFLEAADTKDFAGLLWPGTGYSRCGASAVLERKSSSAVPSLPQGSLRNFPGKEQIYRYPSSLDYAGRLWLPPLLNSLEVSIVSFLQLGTSESTFAGEEAQSKGEPKKLLRCFVHIELGFQILQTSVTAAEFSCVLNPSEIHTQSSCVKRDVQLYWVVFRAL